MIYLTIQASVFQIIYFLSSCSIRSKSWIINYFGVLTFNNFHFSTTQSNTKQAQNFKTFGTKIIDSSNTTNQQFKFRIKNARNVCISLKRKKKKMGTYKRSRSHDTICSKHHSVIIERMKLLETYSAKNEIYISV